MSISEVSIYNLALNAVGARNNVSAPSENSREAEVCNLWYASVRDQILAGAPWPEATKFDYLALLETQDDDVWALGDPKPGYTYAYGLPSDCLRPQHLSNYDRFVVSHYPDNQRALQTNAAAAILTYTLQLTAVSLWSPELRMAIVYALASHICMPLSGKPARAKMAAEQANNLILAARLTAANTSDEQHETLPDWITARGYSGSSSGTRFYYPLGSLLSVSV